MRAAGLALLVLIPLAALALLLAEDGPPRPDRPEEAHNPVADRPIAPESPPDEPAPLPAPPEGPEFRGRVVDEVGRPVPGASIEIRWKEHTVSRAVAGAGGEFSFPSVPIHAEITVRHPGFVMESASTWTLDRTDAVIRIRRGRPLEGVVLRERDRSPVDGARVEVRGKTVRTGADGRFRHPVVPIDEPFDVVVEAGADGRNSLASIRAAPDVPVTVFLPETRVLEGRVVRTTESGAKVGVPGVRVIPVYLDSPGGDPYGFGYFLEFEDGPGAASSKDGTFRLEGLTRAGRIRVESDDWYRPRAAKWEWHQDRIEMEVYPRVTVTGTVVTHDGRPAAGAGVSVAGRGDPTLTDAAGRFRLAGVTMSTSGVRFVARKDGCTGLTHEQGRPGRDVTGLRIRLGDPRDVRTLRGRIVDPEGSPVPFAKIVVEGPGTTRHAGGDGSFEIRWSGKDAKFLGVEAPGFEKKHQILVEEETDLGDVALERLIPWSGRLVDEDGNPVVRAEVGVSDYPPQDGRPVNPDGTFTIGVPEGKLPLVIFAEGYYLDSIRETPDGRDLVLARRPFVGGIVLDLAGKPVIGATVKAGDFEYTETDTAGRFRLDFSERDAVRVEVEKDGLYFPGPFDLEIGVSDHVIRAGVPRHLAGRVVDEKGAPVARARIFVSWGNPEAPFRREAQTDAQGRFRVEPLPEGPVSVFTFVPLPDHYVRIRKGVSPGGEDLELVAERGQSVTGVVVDAEGRPVAHAWVGAESDDPAITSRHADAAEDGTFRLRGLLPAKWKIRAGAYRKREWIGEGGTVEPGATGVKIVIRPKAD